jgi:2,3,4,5-tetrahydropyridine-2-carboxylate N-succinyltransferase
MTPADTTIASSSGSAAMDSPVAADPASLRTRVEALSEAWAATGGQPSDDVVGAARAVVADVLAALESGAVRAAVPDPAAPGGWRAEPWVKAGILLGFRLPGMTDRRDGPILASRDRSAYGVLDVLDGPDARAATAAGAPWRVVPGGTTVRSGAHLEPGVTLMPPSYVNVGAWIGRGSMVDSHVLVGSCAQVGSGVHLGAAVQIGGVLEPPGARPVIVEDDAFVGGGCGLYEGVVLGRGAVLGAGVILTGQGRLVDLVEGRDLLGSPEAPLVVPPGSVVVPGTRPAGGAYAHDHGVAIAVPVIVKRRDAGTSARVALEEALR